MSNLVSKDNLEIILKNIRKNIVETIDKKDITSEQKSILEKSNIIDSITNNSSFLCDNGKYNKIEVDKINDIDVKTNKVYELFNIKENDVEEWSTGKPMPTARYELSSVAYDDKIYCIGSINCIIEIYDTSTDTWSLGNNMPTGRVNLSSEIYNGKIYCIGGKGSRYYNIVEIYDISTNTWCTGNNMPSERENLTSSLSNDKIYCIGGNVYSSYKNIVEIYDISTNTWSVGNSMFTERESLTSEIYNDKIYCIGGYNNNGYLNILEIYDINKNEWNVGISMNNCIRDLASEIYNDKIYCIGNDIIEIYDINKNKWNVDNNSLPTPRFDLVLSIINNKLYCIGGFTNSPTNIVEILSLPYMDYNIKLPSIIQNKLDIINEKGDGKKILSDKGEYIDIPKGYRFMNENEVSEFINKINEV